jgi:hypothetical protein
MGLLKCLIKNNNLDEMHKQSLADKTSEYQAQGMEESIADSLAISELVTELKGDLANIKSLVGIEDNTIPENTQNENEKILNKLAVQDLKTKVGNKESDFNVVKSELNDYIDSLDKSYFVSATDDDVQGNMFFDREQAEGDLALFNEKSKGKNSFEIIESSGLNEAEKRVFKSAVEAVFMFPGGTNAMMDYNETDYNEEVKKIEDYINFENPELSKATIRGIIDGDSNGNLFSFITHKIAETIFSKDEGKSGLPDNLSELKKEQLLKEENMIEAYAKIDAMLESNEITVTCKI